MNDQRLQHRQVNSSVHLGSLKMFLLYVMDGYGCFQKSWYPQSSILIGFSIINHPFWVPLFLETSIYGLFLLDA